MAVLHTETSSGGLNERRLQDCSFSNHPGFRICNLSPSTNVVILPRTTLSWDKFQKIAPANSIALDGVVEGKTCANRGKLLFNFNHHEGCNRLTTPCTARQVFEALLSGALDIAVDRSHKIPITLFLNDPDQDVGLATYILSHRYVLKSPHQTEKLKEIILVSDTLDRASGLIERDPNDPLLKTQAWIYAPYVEARMSGKLSQMNGAAFLRIIMQTHLRIDAHLRGRSEQLELDMRYKVLHQEHGWTMIREQGPYARLRFIHDGIRAFVSYQGCTRGIHRYSIVKAPQGSDFPIQAVFDRLNREEGIAKNSLDHWSGGTHCGGSPRIAGSRFSPRELAAIINDEVSKKSQSAH